MNESEKVDDSIRLLVRIRLPRSRTYHIHTRSNFRAFLYLKTLPLCERLVDVSFIIVTPIDNFIIRSVWAFKSLYGFVNYEGAEPIYYHNLFESGRVVPIII